MSEIKFPYEIIPFTPEENGEIFDYFKGVKLFYTRVVPKGYLLAGGYDQHMATNIYNLPLRSDDVFVVSFPKSGTTWCQELVWLILNDLDYKKAKSLNLHERFPFLEVSVFAPKEDVTDEDKYVLSNLVSITLDQIKELPSPRFIKSHLPLSLLPPNLLDESKVVYIARDPRDVAVSFFHHNKLMRIMEPDGDFKTYWNLFINDKVLWAPYFANVLEAWEGRNHPNMLFLFYEELSKDLPEAIRRVANFFNKKLSDEQIEGLREHLKFDNFKKNKTVNLQDMQDMGLFTSEGGFVRKGKVGGWREYFDEKMTTQAEKWINEKLKGTDFKFPHF